MDIKKVTPEEIAFIFKNRSPLPEGRFRRNAVLVPLIQIQNELHLLYTKRALTLMHQPGDICFPGGKMEEGETPLEAALRETEEELGISRDHIRVLGETDYFVSTSNAFTTPFIGLLENIKVEDIPFSRNEVDSIFTVPLRYFRENTPITAEVALQPIFPKDFPFHLIHNGVDYKWGKSILPQIFYPYQGETIWGITARITNNLCEIIENYTEITE